MSRTPSVAPEPGFNDEESGAQIVFGIARGYLLPNSEIVFGCVDRIRSCVYNCRNTILHESNLLTTVYDIVSRLSGYYFQPLASPSPHVSGSGFISTSCQSRDRVLLFTGFSLMQAWVTQPSPGYNPLEIGKFRDTGGYA